MDDSQRHRVVVIGGGFGGLQAVKVLRRAAVDITLIDRNNYHLFQPLSYQVATGSLAPSEIAAPLRGVFRRDENVRVLLGEVTGFDLKQRELSVEPIVPGGSAWTIGYDSLLVSSGSSYSYFGHEEWRSMALEVKSLDSAIEVRGRILGAFEEAEIEGDPNRRASWLTFVVVGAGPTGVEMAGQIAELARATLPAEFRHSDPRTGRVLLVETADRLLTAYPKSLSARAKRSLEKLGVTPLLGHSVIDVRQDCVEVQAEDGATMEIPARTVIWAAGVMASPLARCLGDACGVEIDKAGRVTVESDLSLRGCPEVLAFGDMVRIRDAKSGEPQTLPGVAPVAMQQGRYAARVITDRLAGRPPTPFRYLDKGTLATIGRASAVADIRGVRLSGFVAWVTWSVVHLFYLIGFGNRVVVALHWASSFFTRGRGARLITEVAQIPANVRGMSPPVDE